MFALFSKEIKLLFQPVKADKLITDLFRQIQIDRLVKTFFGQLKQSMKLDVTQEWIIYLTLLNMKGRSYSGCWVVDILYVANKNAIVLNICFKSHVRL